jgi:hypothetical protein
LKSGKGFFVVMPAWNEAGTVGEAVREAYARGAQKVVVVDDASCDGTSAEAASAGAVVLKPVLQLGAWGATQTGLRYCLRQGCDAVVTMDADGQHRPEFIAALLEPLSGGSADVVIGSCPGRGSRLRKFAWSLFRKITGIPFEDLTSGFRAYNAAALEILALPEATLIDYQDLGVLLLLEHSGMRVMEVPVEMRARQRGHSRIFNTWFSVAKYMLASIVLSVSKSRRTGRIKRYVPSLND